MSLANMQGKMSRKEMRDIMAGSNPNVGSCGHKDTITGEVTCGLSVSYAQELQSTYGGYYCCSSCHSNGGSASYC